MSTDATPDYSVDDGVTLKEARRVWTWRGRRWRVRITTHATRRWVEAEERSALDAVAKAEEMHAVTVAFRPLIEAAEERERRV